MYIYKPLSMFKYKPIKSSLQKENCQKIYRLFLGYQYHGKQIHNTLQVSALHYGGYPVKII